LANEGILPLKKNWSEEKSVATRDSNHSTTEETIKVQKGRPSPFGGW